jgi:membrane protease YdiL (CAAX protease family)
MNEQPPRVKPLNTWRSLILVGIPAVTSAVLLYFVIPPVVEGSGIPFLYLYLPWWIGFMAMFFVASIVAYRLEGNPVGLSHFARRYRLRAIRGRDWLWLAALMVTLVIALAGIAVFGEKLSSLPGLTMPALFPPEINPSHPSGRVAGEFMGVSLKGRWWIAVVYFVGWVVNILGEEFWFRGYMLPRQEAAYGDRAWILHGALWALQHLWQLWTLVIFLPYSFLWSFIIQRGKNTWIPIIVHGLANLVGLVVIVVGVIG